MTSPGWVGALGVTFTMQLAISFLSSAVTVSAPMLTAAAGVPIERIGYFSALSTVASMWYMMSCGPLLGQFGPLRLLQVGLALASTSMLVVIVGEWLALLAAALVFGLGYGPVPAASSDILARRTPAPRRGLAFSIKQAGVPVGQALGGLVVPALALAFGWRAALAGACAACLVLVIAAQPLRAGFDDARSGLGFRGLAWGRILTPANLAQPWRTISAVPDMAWVTYAGFCLACAQGSLFSFYVAYLTADLGFALTAAGTAYAVLQGMGAVGRVLAGWLADRTSATATLMLLGASSCTALVLTASLATLAPWGAVLAVAAFAGLAAVSWNGVYLAEVARTAPAGKVGDTTSASSFFTFIGYAAGPAAFSALVEATGRYDLVFLIFAALPASAIPALLRARRRAAARAPAC
ncbi:MAG: MFS transporter [Alphaproteobacteria bacterium]|nr:MFS transporter [Alphaproteobacteria bacterium]